MTSVPASSSPRLARRRPLGILGGTFDPIHCGHVELAREVRAALALDTLLLVPAGDPPHRKPPAASAAHRLAMVEIAVADCPGLVVDPREVQRSGRSYTMLTLEELRAEHPGVPLLLVVGADAFRGLPQWHRWRELFLLAHIVVVARPGSSLGALPPELETEWAMRRSTDLEALELPAGGSIYQQAITPHDVSASALRAMLMAGRAAELGGLLPAAVLTYIDRNHLYRPGPDAS